jgi:hypothetical protein
MQSYTYTTYVSGQGKQTVTVMEYTFAELCGDEQREVHWRGLPTGSDVRYVLDPKSRWLVKGWRRIRKNSN